MWAVYYACGIDLYIQLHCSKISSILKIFLWAYSAVCIYEVLTKSAAEEKFMQE